MSKSRILNMANMSFNAHRENTILAKISKFTVSQLGLQLYPFSCWILINSNFIKQWRTRWNAASFHQSLHCLWCSISSGCTLFAKIMKKVNKQCLLDTPRTVRFSEKPCTVRFRRHHLCIFKSLIRESCLSSHSCNFVKNYFFWTQLLHAYVQCVYIV